MPTNATAALVSAEPPPEMFLRRLWERMTALYGHAWASAHGASVTRSPDDARLTIDGETWQRALAGVTGQQFAAGLDACITEGGEFPPSAPRFRAMCLGIPPFARVKLETTMADAARSPFTRFVWGFVDGYAFRQADMRAADALLRAAYDVAVEARMHGAELPASAAELAAPGKPQPKPADPAVAARHLASIARMFGSDDDRAEIDAAAGR